MNLAPDIRYVGVNDHQLDLFEGLYAVPNGMSYNSYLIPDEKTAVIDSVDRSFGGQWLERLRTELGERQPDYLIVQHMEPDHSANIALFMETYPTATVVSSAPAFSMMAQFFQTDFPHRRMVVKDGDTLSLGRHTLSFIAAPMVHWPEVTLTYDAFSRTLFSADAFGKFGALDVEEDWLCEARRYYVGIVGKFGAPVQSLLKKLAPFDIQAICPLHGPPLTENLDYYLNKYQIWSSYQPEDEGVVIAYASIYGNTAKAADLLAQTLRGRGCPAVAVHDLSRCDISEAVEDAFRYSKLVLAAPTYNGGLFPPMDTFLRHLTERNFQNRAVALMENGTWAPAAGKGMRELLADSKSLTFVEPSVIIRSALNEESLRAMDALAGALWESAPPPKG